MNRRIPGTVIQIDLGNGRFAYGRLFRDASIGIYRDTSASPRNAPIGSRDYRFIVGISDRALRDAAVEVVGSDAFVDEDDWPPPLSVTDPITRTIRIYHRGVIRDAHEDEIPTLGDLEPAAVWDLQQIVDRIQGRAGFRRV